MLAIDKIQTEIEKLLKPLPKMPVDAIKWLSDNFWILTAVSAVLMGLSIITIIGGVIAAYTVTTSFMGYYSYVYNPGIWWLIQSLFSIAALVVSMIFMAKSIKPLRAFEKKGWDLMFLAIIVSVAFVVVNGVLSFSIISMIGAIVSATISLAIGSYILFEIKPNFKK